jgi:hypothetical protein
MFVGSTKDLQKLVKQQRELVIEEEMENEEKDYDIIDVEIDNG